MGGGWLCIVPPRREPRQQVFLPFEDGWLTLILSKAFLLADEAGSPTRRSWPNCVDATDAPPCSRPGADTDRDIPQNSCVFRCLSAVVIGVGLAAIAGTIIDERACTRHSW
jgi:hypothetical protein